MGWIRYIQYMPEHCFLHPIFWVIYITYSVNSRIKFRMCEVNSNRLDYIGEWGRILCKSSCQLDPWFITFSLSVTAKNRPDGTDWESTWGSFQLVGHRHAAVGGSQPRKSKFRITSSHELYKTSRAGWVGWIEAVWVVFFFPSVLTAAAQITGNLVRSKLRVAEEKIHILPMNTAVTVEGVKVVLLDANQWVIPLTSDPAASLVVCGGAESKDTALEFPILNRLY